MTAGRARLYQDYCTKSCAQQALAAGWVQGVDPNDVPTGPRLPAGKRHVLKPERNYDDTKVEQVIREWYSSSAENSNDVAPFRPFSYVR